jgi:hypothetical protein
VEMGIDLTWKLSKYKCKYVGDISRSIVTVLYPKVGLDATLIFGHLTWSTVYPSKNT